MLLCYSTRVLGDGGGRRCAGKVGEVAGGDDGGAAAESCGGADARLDQLEGADARGDEVGIPRSVREAVVAVLLETDLGHAAAAKCRGGADGRDLEHGERERGERKPYGTSDARAGLATALGCTTRAGTAAGTEQNRCTGKIDDTRER